MKRSAKERDMWHWLIWRLEPILWTTLSISGCIKCRSWSLVATAIGSVGTLWFLERNVHKRQHDTSSTVWRNDDGVVNCFDPQGRSMAAEVVPLLMGALSQYVSINHTNYDPWSLYANLFSITHVFIDSRPIIGISVTFFIAAAVDPTMMCLKTFWILSFWCGLDWTVQTFPRLHQVFTQGEWWVISGILVVGVVESCSQILQQQESLHVVVSIAGMLGSGAACLVASPLLRLFRITEKKASLIGRALVLVVTPFASIEALLAWCKYQGDLSAFRPRCVLWLISFLNETETTTLDSTTTWPRRVWLLYWVVILMVTFSLSPSVKRCYNSIVVARKWFHFIAVALFAPVTVLAPQLMSLGYAVALSLLLLVENLRQEEMLPPWVQAFYSTYLDADKDRDGRAVVTHMALIAGCAVPLWISEIVNYPGRFLPQWGIICLGVGDAMGAIVGTLAGRTRWHPCSKRTMEGSAAAWISMAVACLLVVDTNERWFPLVSFVTLLEASTQQIDNLVLPVAGTIVILMQHCG